MATKTPEEKAAEKQAKVLADLALLNVTPTGGTTLVTPITGTETIEQLEEKLKIAKREAKEAAEKASKEATPPPVSPETPGPQGATLGASTPIPPSAPTGPIVVKYRDHEGKPTERTFSADVHGENFGAVADEFKATNKDRLITE